MGRFLLGSTVVMLFPKASTSSRPLAFNPAWAPARPILLGEVMATCFEDSGEQCGSAIIGNVPHPVGVVADADGELWVLSQDGLIVPITAD